MSSKHLRGDVNYAWPTAEIAVMGPKGAVEIIFRADSGDAEKIAQRTEAYHQKFANPIVAASRGFIDGVIMPHGTRLRLCRALNMLRDKQLENPWKKHSNTPRPEERRVRKERDSRGTLPRSTYPQQKYDIVQ